MNKNKRNSKKVLAAICAFSGAFGGNSGASAALKNKKVPTVKTDVKSNVKSKNLSLNRQSGNKNFFGKAWDLIKANPVKSSLITAGGLTVAVGTPLLIAKLIKGKKDDKDPNKKNKKEIKENQKNQDKLEGKLEDKKIGEFKEEKEIKEEIKENQEIKEEIKKEEIKEIKEEIKEIKEIKEEIEIEKEEIKIEPPQQVPPKEVISLNHCSNGEGLLTIGQKELSTISNAVKQCFNEKICNDFVVFKLGQKKEFFGQDEVHYIVIFNNNLTFKKKWETFPTKISDTGFNNFSFTHKLGSMLHNEAWEISKGVDLSFDAQNRKFNLVKK